MLLSEAYASYDMYELVNNGKTEKTRREYRSRILGRNGFVTIVGDLRTDYIGIDHVLGWKLHLRDEGLQPGYINDMLSVLRLFLAWLAKNEHKVFDWHKIEFEKEEQNKPKTLLTPDEVGKLKRVLNNPRDIAIVDLFFGSGMRSEELINIDRYEWEGAFVINDQAVRIDDAEPIWELQVCGKNEKWRAIHFSQGVKNSVDDYLKTRVDRYRPLFVSLQNRRISYHTISRMLHAAAAKAGMTKVVTQHVFRHSNATELAVNGMPIPVLAAHLGHKDGVVTQRIYTNEISAIQTRKAYAQAYAALKT